LNIPSDSRAVLRFGPFQVDLASGELHKHKVKLRLQEQPFQILVMLLENPGEVVTRDELRNKLWSADTFVDFDVGLNNAILRLRNALGDSAEKPRFIETLPRRGYRFIAPVDNGTAARTVAFPQSDSVSPAEAKDPSILKGDSAEASTVVLPRRGLARLWFGLAIAAVFVMLLWGLNLGRHRLFDTTPSPRIQTLAVLPLENLSGDPSQEYFADGMTDELTTDLASIASLSVISRTSTSHYKDTRKTLPEIARELHVDAVIEGTVVRSGDQVRITVQLIDAKNDRHIWAQSYDRQGNDVLGLQRDLSKAIASQVHLSLTPSEARRLEALPTRDSQAYDAYLRAKYHAITAIEVEADADATITLSEQAVALDPNFAGAYVVIAQGCFAKIFDWAGGKEYDKKAFFALGKALALDPNLAEAYATRGSLYYTRLHNFDIASAVADYRRAISLGPNLAEAHHNLGAELTHVGLHDQAIEEFRTTLRLDPQNEGAKYRLGRALWQSQRFAEALEHYQRHNIESFEKALTLAYLGRRQQAWETIDGVAQQLGGARRGGFRGDPEDVSAVRAFLYATENKPQKAEQEIQIGAMLGKNNDHFHHAAFILAAACAEMGKPHEAVTWLRRVAESGMPNYPLFRDNPSMNKLHVDPEYEQFMAQLKLRWDQLAASL
jgi:TolB-like protein/DNA-binding winged helix-turn-helix (wHTH) protein/Tfp pilus assembly protein PilF